MQSVSLLQSKNLKKTTQKLNLIQLRHGTKKRSKNNRSFRKGKFRNVKSNRISIQPRYAPNNHKR